MLAVLDHPELAYTTGATYIFDWGQDTRSLL